MVALIVFDMFEADKVPPQCKLTKWHLDVYVEKGEKWKAEKTETSLTEEQGVGEGARG